MQATIKATEITHFDQLQHIQKESLKTLTIESQSLAGSRVKSSNYDGVIFQACVFYACHFEGVVFTNCNFKQCHFNFTHFKGCHFENCIFEDCVWGASTTHDSSYVDCELDTWLSAMTEGNGNIMHFTFALAAA